MTKTAEQLQALAEAAAPLARELTLALLQRPVPACGQTPLSLSAIDALCRELDELLTEATPVIADIAADMAQCDAEEIDEIFEDLAPPAIDLVDMARKIWELPLPREAEGMRPLLAALAEDPVVQLIALLLRINHAVIDPWAVMDNPEKPIFSFVLPQKSKPHRSALSAWRQANPGIVPESVLV